MGLSGGAAGCTGPWMGSRGLSSKVSGAWRAGIRGVSAVGRSRPREGGR